MNLGRVIDKYKHMFQNRKNGVFVYNPEDGSISKPSAEVLLPERRAVNEKLIVDFGDSYFLHEFIRQEGLDHSIDAIDYGSPHTMHAMIQFYVLCSLSNAHAEEWYEGSYARVLFPKANLVSQRISDFLEEIGSEQNLRLFFHEYVQYVNKTANGGFTDVLIDSTGLPNSIHFPLTAVSNHNGKISNEIRLIYVTQQETGLPIYFRYVSGNIVDVSTLIRTIDELKEAGVNTKFSVLDAGYYTVENAKVLFANKASFISRLRENLTLYKDLKKKYLAHLESPGNLVRCCDRYVYIKRVQVQLIPERKGYAFVCLDIERKNDKTQKFLRRAGVQKPDTREVYETMQTEGVFILVSSRPSDKEKILPLYYTRQQIGQIFDIGKNYADLMPVRIRKEETLRGHLLLTFIATVIVKRMQDKLKDTNCNPVSALLNLRNQKCRVYDDQVITCEPAKKANDCYKLFRITCPTTIPLRSN